MKVKIAMVVAIIMCSSCVEVFAQLNKPVYDILANEIIINGTTPSGKKNRPVSIRVENPDLTLQYANTVLTDENGEYNFTFKLHMDDVNDYGIYKIYVSGYDYNNIKQESVYVPSLTEVDTIINNLNGGMNKQTLVVNISDYLEMLGCRFELFEKINNENFAEIILEETQSKPFSKEDISDILFRLKRSAVVVAFNEGLATEVLESDGLIYNDLLKIEDIDTDGVTLYNVYENYLSKDGKVKLFADMMNGEFVSYSSWLDEFAKQVVLKTVQYPSVGGVQYVSEIITKKNAQRVGLSCPKYFSASNKGEINSNVARKEYANINKLAKALVPTSGSGDSPGGGSCSGSSGSSGFLPGGGYTLPVNNTENKKEEPILEMSVFSDISADYWLFEALYDLKELEIISGDAEGNFRPDDYVKREEFLKMLCKALKIPEVSSDKEFLDVEKNSWYETYVNTAYENGIVTGIKENFFGVGEYISRQDLCTMIFRALNAQDEDIEKPIFGFDDNESIATYAKDAIDYLYMKGTVNGFDDHTFRPNENCTRAHAAKIVYSVMRNLKAQKTE